MASVFDSIESTRIIYYEIFYESKRHVIDEAVFVARTIVAASSIRPSLSSVCPHERAILVSQTLSVDWLKPMRVIRLLTARLTKSVSRAF